jgi:diguanylate cyclase (GGDEF)-like protein
LRPAARLAAPPGLARTALRVVHAFIPASVGREEDALLRSRILVATALVFLATVVLEILAIEALGILPLGRVATVHLIAIAAGLCATLAVLRASGSLVWAGNALAASLFASLAAGAACLGGLGAATAPVLLLVPLLGGLLAGPRSGTVWTGAAVVAWGVLFAVEDHLPAPRDEGSHSLALLAALSLACVAISTVVVLYERMNARLRRELSKEHALFEYLAGHDTLTRLSDRRTFLHQLELALADGRGRRRVAVLVVDLDGFKSVNELHGHAVGDALLREAAERMRRGLRPGDRLARLGGDEFGVLVKDARTREDVEVVADKLAEWIAAPVEARGVTVETTARVGLARATEDVDAEGLVERADRAMYHAKARRLGRCWDDDPAVDPLSAPGGARRGLA